ncbi:dual specificity tyrosine-phosphorylation-regulated kinase 2-like [Acropora muricata]|uniref:dual specificity tyrosine-phosphorylation-regulated kinase 2-like n=1 Tax=Acropora muricata TaxID=159855 RepID=UPI0034E57087
MSKCSMELLRSNGAFSPAFQGYRRENEHFQRRVSPPKRFVATQLSGGVKVLYKRLRNKEKPPHQRHVPGAQTDQDGKFQPCYPVPLLAGRYKFMQVLGQGQSSILIAVQDTFHPDKRPVAVKVMNLNNSYLGAQEAECVRKLNAADVLKVSRTIQLFNTFTFEDHYCLVFELVSSRPLHQYFQRCQFKDEDRKLSVIRKIALQLVQVLGFLKGQNVIHADLKPENILIQGGEDINIKVVDFGNALHCVDQEVSLYYDDFELQTLVYRAPEVMFGIPFGLEIDMWSLGCILAELYIGECLFLGKTKKQVLKEVTTVFGPFPKNPFQSGKFIHDFLEFVGQNSESNKSLCVTNMMKKLLNSRNYAFSSFLVGLLQYNPNERLTPCQAAMHPFLAPEFPFRYLLSQQGCESEAVASSYSEVVLPSDQYFYKPVKVGGIEPLKREDLCCRPEKPLETTQSLPIHIKCNCCPELDFAHHSAKDFKHGMSQDGTLCEGDNLKIKNDGHISRTDEMANTNLSTVSHKGDDTVKSLNFKDHRRWCFKEVILQENIPTVKIGAKIALEEHSNVLDDQTCSAARIRGYQGKSISTKDEINDLSPELKYRKRGGPEREKRHFLSLDTECSERKKLQLESKDQMFHSKESTSPSHGYQEDVVMLL